MGSIIRIESDVNNLHMDSFSHSLLYDIILGEYNKGGTWRQGTSTDKGKQ